MSTYPPSNGLPQTGPRRALSPEIVAVALIVVIGIGGVLAVAGGSPDGSGSPTAPPAASSGSVQATAEASEAASASLVVPTLAIASSVPTPGPTPTAAAFASTPTWAADARALIEADERLIEWREALRTELARPPARSDELAHLLRSTNVAIQVASGYIDALETADAPVDIVGALRSVHGSALDSGLRTLTILRADVKAYRAGAAEVIAALEPLETDLQALAASAGLPDPLPELRSSTIPSTSPAP
jgi:hypothetical protein